MTPLPTALDAAAELVAWRLDYLRYLGLWNSGIGAEKTGGRWNPRGFKAVYCSIDPSTCIVEAAVHRGFPVLDTTPHVLTSLAISDATDVHVVQPDDVPNAAWLHGGTPSAGQQSWGADLLSKHSFVVFPSAVSKESWNVVFEPSMANGKYALRTQGRLVLDTRLNPPS
jgi:RES domain-containing protein